MKNTPTLLIKFGERKNLERLLKEGLLHCKSIKWFSEHEDGKLRGDEFEAVVRTEHFQNKIFQVKEADNPDAQWKKLKVTKGLYKEYYKEPFGNLYCMSLFPVGEGSFEINQKFKEFGNSFVLICNQVEFFRRLEMVLSDLCIQFCKGNIEYLDLHTHSGQKGLYQKDAAYSFQQEYRIHLHREATDTFEFSIGSIEDIACLYNCDETKSFLIRKNETL